ncbi:ABC transporter permease [Anaerosacchariphilus polymeriproducens]|uniref:ABC transporter permease n=1 Tax=Anaerosacchariphilus polymeriproducens TaxID=1812858 RepID=A0A371AVX2_9FIRM|nr:ABC transporter permease [Anaerosacchariphilus polymeriproducens]RDU23718.1 ABC transporter permease [Anaerosacchariphilus polymeriproducens]
MNILYFIIQQTMYFAIPLLIVAIGGMYAERSGVINIALEGIMVMGAFVGISFISIFQDSMNGQLLLILAILVSGVVGGIFSLLHAFASINMKADQTISGTALNMFAPAFAIYVARMVQGTQQIAFTDTFYISKVPVLGDIPVIGDMFFKNCYIITYIGIAIYLVAAYVIKNTKYGLRLRACGEHPGAADSVGVNVAKIRYSGVIVSGVLAGIGGIVFVVPTSTNFNATVAGYGFLAIAVLIFGQWRSNKILMAAFFFGIMKTLSSAYSAIPFLNALPVSSEIYKMFPYIATLVLLAFVSKNSQAPKAEGIPYDKSMR